MIEQSCKRGNIVSSNDRDLIDRQREHFNSIAARYHAERNSPNHLYLKKLMWGRILGDITRFCGRRIDVLEPMCGFSDGLQIAGYLSDQVSYSGFDFSDTVVSMLKSERPELNIWHADATQYEPPPQAFDVIVLIGGLHHTPDHAASIVSRLAKGLRPQGLFISYEPTSGNPLFRKVRARIYKKNSLFDEKTERDFRVDELLRFFSDEGLRPIKVRYPGLLSYVLFYNPDAFPALNVGGNWLVKTTFELDRLFYGNRIGRWLSFATLSIWERPA